MRLCEKAKAFFVSFFCFFAVSCLTLDRLNHQVDLSASKEGLKFLKSLKDMRRTEKELDEALDKLLSTAPFKKMFLHYNRPIRPNELPPEIFKAMILSLRFPERYQKGSNQRADSMLPHWKKAYGNIAFYESLLGKLSQEKTLFQVEEAIQYSNTWLPLHMKVPQSSLFILPQGGSSAFVVPYSGSGVLSQGVDLFQLASPGEAFSPEGFFLMVSHESHHLGYMKYSSTQNWSPSKMFMAITVAEGVANAVFNDLPNSKGKSFGFRRDYKEELSGKKKAEWEAYGKQRRELFKAYLKDVETLTKNFNHETMKPWWQGQFKQKLYFIGVEAVHKAYEVRGKKAVFELMKNPILILSYLEDLLNEESRVSSL